MRRSRSKRSGIGYRPPSRTVDGPVAPWSVFPARDKTGRPVPCEMGPDSVREHYPDASTMLAACDRPPVAGIGSDHATGHEARISGNEAHWYGGHGSIAAARRAAASGAVPQVRDIAAPSVAAIVADGIRARVVHAVAGGSVDVPRLLEGRPDAMRRIVRRPRPQRVARVRVNFGANANVEAKALRARGLEVLAAVHAVERQGLFVELTCGWRTDAGPTQGAQVTFTLKRPGQPLDWQAAAFWLSDPAALRVFGFAWCDRCLPQALRDALGHGIGHAMHLERDASIALDIGVPFDDEECYAARAEDFIATMTTAVGAQQS